MTELFTKLAALDSQAKPQPAGLDALGVDPVAVLAQAVTFLALFWLVKKFALDKIVAALEERRQTIDKGVRLGLKMQAETERLNAMIDRELHKVRAEADKIVAMAHEEAGDIIRQAEDKATAKAAVMLTEARARLEDDIRLARLDLQKEVVGLVADATEAVIGERLTAEKDERFIRRVLAEVRR